MADQGNINDVMSQLMLVLGGQQPAGPAPTPGAQHRQDLFKQDSPAVQAAEQAAAFQRLQMQGQQPLTGVPGATAPQAAGPNMLQRALGSLFGGQ